MNALEPVSISRIRQIIGLIDLTNLDDHCDHAAIDALSREALTPAGHVAALCVWPAFVADARHSLGQQSPIKIATVVNFPSGADSLETIGTSIVRALKEGADEIDYVLPYSDLMNGNADIVAASIGAVRQQIPNDKTLKVILETGVLETPELISTAATIAIDQGADFIKTSTGKVPVNATINAASIMLDAIARLNRNVGFKAAGGVKTIEDANLYLTLAEDKLGKTWADATHFRFGASGLLNNALKHLDLASATDNEGGY